MYRCWRCVLPVLLAVSMVTAVQTCMFAALAQAFEEKAIYFTRCIPIGMTCLTQLPKRNGPLTMNENCNSYISHDVHWIHVDGNRNKNCGNVFF